MNQLLVDCTGWGVVRVTGADRVRLLQGLTTVNVEALATGGHAWGAILNPKGRVLSVIEVVRHDDHLLVECEPGLLDKTAALLDRYAVMDDVTFERQDGPAHRVWTTAASVWEAPLVLAPAPGPVADPAAVEVLRVEAGLPRYGVDVDEDCFPFETSLTRVLDYGKGCYIGQEPVFRDQRQVAQLDDVGVDLEVPVVLVDLLPEQLDAAARDDPGRIRQIGVIHVVGVLPTLV